MYIHVYIVYQYNLTLTSVRLLIFQNVLDDRLKHANSGVVLGGIHLFLHLTNNMPHLLQDVYDRIKCKTCIFSHSPYYMCSFIHVYIVPSPPPPSQHNACTCVYMYSVNEN